MEFDQMIEKSITSQYGFLHGFVASLSMTLFSEIGDKTFFIAAIMAMRNNRLIVFTAGIGALALMTVISVSFGFVTAYIPRIYTFIISTILFIIFGIKMIVEGILMKPQDQNVEMEMVQTDIRNQNQSSLSSTQQESSQNVTTPIISSIFNSKPLTQISQILASFFSRIFFQTATMTFLAEWGDRSQISTIALASTENIYGVMVGGILSHSICTGVAVLGGRLLATKISVKAVTIIGGFVFIAFAIFSVVREYTDWF